MDKAGYQRSLIALIVGLVVLVILYLVVPGQPITPRGILLPIEKSRPAISPDQVTFYNESTLGSHYQKMGYINVQFHAVNPTSESELVLVNYVKQLAAQQGANGVMISLFGHTLPNEVANAQASYVFRGTAVYVNTQ